MDFKNFWLAVLRRLEPTISRAQFLTWFRDTIILTQKTETLVIGVPTLIAREHLAQKFTLKVLQAAAEIDASVKEVEFEVDAALSNGADPRTIDLAAVFARPQDKKIYRVRGRNELVLTTTGLRSAKLNPRFTLANFVPTDENRLAHAAALAIARNPGRTYNPLFIYGGVGLGKTHLLSAIGHEILTNNPNNLVVFTTAEIFTREFSQAAQKRSLEKFKRQFLEADVLLFDDVQFLEGREGTQTALFNLFNELHAAGKQIVFTSDRPPLELTEIMERLRSRMTWGLTAEIEFPSYESRLAILKTKVQAQQTVLDPEILDFIAVNVGDSVRALEGTLVWVTAQINLLATQPTLRDLSRMLTKANKKEEILGAPQENFELTVKTPTEILELVANYFQIPKEEILSRSRQKKPRLARQIIMHLARQNLGSSLSELARQFNRDPATVLHSCRAISANLKVDEVLVRKVNGIKKEMGL